MRRSRAGSSFKISVQIVRLLETLYDLVNWRDYFVYVRSVAPCDEGGPECYQMVLSLSPVRRRHAGVEGQPRRDRGRPVGVRSPLDHVA